MEVMFSGFDDGGWWLVVLGRRGRGWRPPEMAENWLQNTQIALGAGWRVRERKERENGFLA